MGDCDRMKKHITDYLEHTLNPSTQKEFEQILGKDEQLKKITSEVDRIADMLGNLQSLRCSENFNVNLREKILLNRKLPENYPVRRYVLSVSVAALFIFVLVIFNPFSSEENENSPLIPEASMQLSPEKNKQNVNQADNTNTDESFEGRDIKTLEEAQAQADSTKDKSAPKLKHVDQKEIQETQP